MNNANNIDFDQWFDIFQSKVKALGWTGPIDKYTFEWNWEDGETPEKAAEDFANEMNS